MLDFLLQENMTESMSTSCLEQLHYGLICLAAGGHRFWTEKLYSEIVCKCTTGFWTSMFGPRLIHLSLSHGWLSFVSQLTKDMVTTVCHCFASGSSDKQLGCVSMMRLFKLMAYMYLRPFQKEDIKEIQLSLKFSICILNLYCPKEHFFHIFCEMGKYDVICYILDVVSPTVREKLFLALDHMRRSPLFCTAIHGHMDVVRLLFQRGCPVTHPSPVAYSELNAAVLHVKFTRGKKGRSLEMYCGRYNPDIIQFFASESDFNRIMNLKDYLCILVSVAHLPKLELVRPILNSLLDHMEPLKTPACDVNNTRIEEFTEVQDRAETVIRVLPQYSAFSQESLNLLDAIMSNIVTWKLGIDLVCIACEKGLWLVIQNSLLTVSHADDGYIFHILCCALKQGRHEYLSLICTKLREEGRRFLKGFPEILCGAVRYHNASAIEFLLELGEEGVNLISPLSLAIFSHSHSLADMFLDKIATDSATYMTNISRVLQLAARYKNHHVLEKLLMLPSLLLNFQTSEEKKISFWFVVLTEATKYGHEDLALQAISSLSQSQLLQIQRDEAYSYIQMLGWCCYWGMTNALNCLPFTVEMLLTPTLHSKDLTKVDTTSYGIMSPWWYAEASGNVGKLSHVDSLQLTNEAAPALFQRNAECLLLGVFSKFVASHKGSETSHKTLWHPKYSGCIVFREAYFGLTNKLEAFFEHLGAYKSSHFEFICKAFSCNDYFPDLLLAACHRRDNFPAVHLILKYMVDSGLNLSNHVKMKMCLKHSIKLGETSCVQALVHYFPRLFLNVQNDENLLTYAILSKSPEMVDYILDLLDYSPDCCFQKGDTYDDSPLCTAFSFGCSNVILNSELVSVASKAKEFKFSSWEHASSCMGWFNLMMENNAKAISSSGNLNVQSTSHSNIVPFQMSLRRNMNSERMKLSLLHASATHQVHSVTEAIIQANGGVISKIYSDQMLVEVIAEILLDETVYNFMSSHSYCEEILQSFKSSAEELNLMGYMLKKLYNCYGYEDKIIRLLKLFHPLSADLKKTLLDSCKFGKGQVVKYLLFNTDFGEETTSILQTGLTSAVYNGHFDIAADIMLRLDITHIQIEEDQTPLHHLILSNPNYFDILDKFFASLIDPTERMPLAALWLVYDWSEREAELVVHQLGSMYAPPNPWLLPRKKSDMTITIDWDSFSESLLTSPGSAVGHKNPGRSHYVPLVVEATVFTQAVLGQLVPSSFTSGKGFRNPKDAGFLSVLRRLSSVILTCTVWPSPPSFSSFEASHGILTICYQPSTKSFVFPDLVPTNIREPDYHEEAVSIFSTVLNNISSLTKFYEKKMKTLFGHPYKVKVNTGASLISEMDKSLSKTCGIEKCDLYYTLASSVLQDVVDALKLTLIPKSSPQSLRLEQNVTSTIEISLDCNSDESNRSHTSMKNSILSIVVFLPCGEFSLETSELYECSFYNNLVDDTRGVILNEHVRLAQHDSKIKMENMVRSMLVASLKISVLTVTVNVTPEDVIGEAVNPNSLNLGLARSLVLYVKYVNRLRLYLKHFCKMLNIFQNEPKLYSSLRNLFVGSFHIFLTKSATEPTFEIKQGRKRLILPVQSLQTRKRLYNSLLCGLRSVMSTLTMSENPSSHNVFSPFSLPVPTACYVDYHESQGLLFPVKGAMGNITVQMVNYNGDHLKDSLSGATTLKIRIMHLESKLSIEGYSNTTPTLDGAEKLLLVKENSDGTVRIEWTPQNTGLYSVYLRINGIDIEGSPHRCHCADHDTDVTRKKKISAVFVVEHLAECPLTSKPLPVKLYNKKSIRPLFSPPLHLSRESFIQDLLHGPTHHISMCSAFGGAKNWIYLASSAVSIHISNNSTGGVQNKSFRLQVVPLANGLHHVTIMASAITTGSFSLFASCPLCQSVMKVHWGGGSSVCPTSFSIISGKVSAGLQHTGNK